MKLVILDKKTYGKDIDYSQLYKEFDETEEYAMADQENIAELVKDADVILVNKKIINEDSLNKAGNLKLILVGATGYNNIDLEYCRSHGIAVANVPGYSVPIVAQHTFALYLSLSEHITYYDHYVKCGSYSASDCYSCFDPFFQELEGKTWGIIGLGAIGHKVASIAEAFGCRVIYYSTSGKNNDPCYARVNFPELLTQSDVISIHAPLNSATQNLMNADAFRRMKRTAFLINVARGPIVNEKALAEALDLGEIAGAGVDVMEKEPLPCDSPLLFTEHPERLLMTPHMAWGSVESRQRLMDGVVENLRAFKAGISRNRVEGL